jgi:hypothetical protein
VRLLFLAPLLLSACGPNTFDLTPCSGLQVDVLDSIAEPPANVAAMVRVSDCASEPLGVTLDESAFELAEEGSVLSGYEASRMVRPAEKEIEGRVLIALDLSGSITRAGLRPLMIESARTIVSAASSEQQIAVFGFDGRPDLVPFTYFTADRAEVAAALDTAASAPLVDDSTNLYGAIISGLAVLDHVVRIEEEDPSVVAHGTLVVFTDGGDHAGYVDSDTVRSTLDSTPHSVFAVGIGSTIDDETLAKIGRTDYALATGQVGDAFAEVTRKIAARASADYVVSYCTPARAGERTLEIRVQHDQLTGTAELSFDATGFGAGCSPEASPLK